MEVLLTVLLCIFVGFWLLGRIGRWLLAAFIRRAQQRGGQSGSFGGGPFRGFYQFGGPGRDTPPQNRPEGEVTITGQPESNAHKVPKQVGEYVDYEEVKGSE